MIAAPGASSLTDLASVGFGAAAGMPPNDEQEPTQIVAAAFFTSFLQLSTALSPPVVQYAPSAPVGIEPSTIRMYWPLYFSIAACLASSA